MKAVAADLDRSTSELSRWLSSNPDDPRNLPADVLPELILACGDRGKDIVHWLIESCLEDPGDRKQRAQEVIAQLGPLLAAAMKELDQGDAGQ